MGDLIARIDRIFYPQYDRNWDDELFRRCVLQKIERGSVVLDLGAGAGVVRQMNFKGMVAKVCGVDVDPRVASNPMLDEGVVSDAGCIPYPDKTFDVVFSDNVVEHLEDPASVFSEVCRVLKPGGVFLFKTPNKWHYMPIIARMTPYWFHRFFNRLRGRPEEDTFKTLYLANSVYDIRMVASKSGLRVVNVLRVEGRPEYLRLTWLTYLMGLAYERIVNSVGFLAFARILLVAELKKPHGG